MNMDFAPTSEQISLHGLGFIQVKLPMNQRLHVWHPELPRRACFEHSAIHNHRFSFRSTVLVGVQANRRWQMQLDRDGEYTVISHNGPRSEKGGRLSYPVARANMVQVPTNGNMVALYGPGESYTMAELEYHDTPNDGIVVTLMEKLTEGKIHANSVIRHPHDFDYDFDRFQLSPARLWDFVLDALRGAA